MQRQLTLVCVHGEGSRDTAVRRLREGLLTEGRDPSPAEKLEANVLAVLREGDTRLELPLKSWQEVEEFKKLPGVWDKARNRWTVEQAKVTLTVG